MNTESQSLSVPAQLLGQLHYLWRVLATGLAFLLFSVGGFLFIALPTLILIVLPINKDYRQGVTRRLISRVFSIYLLILRGLGLITFHFEGLENLKENGQFVIANHPTLLDVVLLISAIRKADCLIKADLLKMPLTASAVRSAGYIPNGSEDTLDLCVNTLNKGYSLVVFPEGTRTVNLQAPKFLRGAANIALACESDITPVWIRCEPLTLRKGEPWYRICEKPPVFTVKVLPPIKIEEFLSYSEWPSQRARHLTKYLQSFYQHLAERSRD